MTKTWAINELLNKSAGLSTKQFPFHLAATKNSYCQLPSITFQRIREIRKILSLKDFQEKQELYQHFVDGCIYYKQQFTWFIGLVPPLFHIRIQ